MLIKFLFVLVLYILINNKFVYSKEYPLEQYYIINRNYYDKYYANIQPNPDLITYTVYSRSLYGKIRAIKKTEPNYREEVIKLLNNGKVVDFENYFTKDPFDIFLDSRVVTRNTLLNFTISFGEGIITNRRKDRKRFYQVYNSYYQDENEKDIIEMYKYMLTMGNENIDFDEILDKDINQYNHIERSLNMEYAISSLSNQNILNWILYDTNNPIISNLYNNYGRALDTDNFLNLAIETLISDHPNIGLALDSQEKFDEFKTIIESLFTRYSFPNNFVVYAANNNTDLSLGYLSSDLNADLYNFYLNIERFVHNSKNSIMDLILQELLIRNIKESNTKKKINIERETFLKSVSEIFDVYKNLNEFVSDILLWNDMDDNLIAEQLLAANSIAKSNIIGTMVNSNGEDLKKIILNYDIVLKYFETTSEKYYNLLVEDANIYINMYSFFNSDNFFNRFLYTTVVESDGGFINDGTIVPYHTKMKENNYYYDIIYAVSLIKEDLNSLFQMGDTLIYGYERSICFEIDDEDNNLLFITNKIDKNCIFKGSSAANEAIYKLVKYYYDTFIANCQEDIENLNSATSKDIMTKYLSYNIISDNEIVQLKLPTINMYKELNFEKINKIFNSIYNEHEDAYISAASNLIKKMGLYMIDIDLLNENLYNETEEVESFELKDIELPKSRILEIEGLNSNNLSWGSDIIDVNYNDYFEYQYFALYYYIEDQGENVKGNYKLDKTILLIKELSKNIIQKNNNYYGNIILLNDIIEKYEMMIDIITEYIYQYGIGYIKHENYIPDDMITNEYYKLVDDYNDYFDKLDTVVNISYEAQLLASQFYILEYFESDILDCSNKIREMFLNQSDRYSMRKRENDSEKTIKSLQYYSMFFLSASISHYVSKSIEENFNDLPVEEKNLWITFKNDIFKLVFALVSFNISLQVGDSYNSLFQGANAGLILDSLVTTSQKLYKLKKERQTSPVQISDLPKDDNLNRDGVIEGKSTTETPNNNKNEGANGGGYEDGRVDINIENPSGSGVCANAGPSESRKRASTKTRCNKKQIIRDSVYTKENVKSTVKNNIGKLEDIDPTNGYKELADSMDYAEFLSNEFPNADDFSEDSKFGENLDSPSNFDEISKKMSDDTNTLKGNVGTALTNNMLTKSRRRKRRRPRNRGDKVNAIKSADKIKTPNNKSKSKK